MNPVRAGGIETERLTLLPLRVAHAPEMAAVLSDPALYTYVGGTPPAEEELRARYTRMIAGSPDPAVSWCNWVLRVRTERGEPGEVRDAGEPGETAGTVQATVTTVTPGARGTADDGPVAEIAWMVGTPWQRRGLATEAALGLVRWLEDQGVSTLIAHIRPGHAASAAVARACGLAATDVQHEGETRWERRLTP